MFFSKGRGLNGAFTLARTHRSDYGFLVHKHLAAVLFATDAMAVKIGEMRVGVTYLTGLLDNNIIPLVLLTGKGAGAAVPLILVNLGSVSIKP